MPRTFVHLAFFLFVITALSGIWMRTVPFVQNILLDYENILHGHSHIAILGWAFLGLFIIFLAISWPNLKQKKHGIILAIAIFTTSFVMFIAFLYEGYATYSIIMSTLHIFVEYWAVYFIYKQLKSQNHLPQTGQLFIKGSLIALVISTIGPFLLGYLGATGLKESQFFDMSIYFFLHFQYNGWLFLFLIGLFIIILHGKSIRLSPTLTKYGFWIYFSSLLPWYVSAILWADLGGFAKVVATIGTIGQFIGVVIILVTTFAAWKPMKRTFSKVTYICIGFTLVLLLLKSTMELGLISDSLSALVFDTRSVIIGYLHFTLLGFVSLFILSQFQMIDLIDAKRRSVALGVIIFLTGFVMNELLLFLTGLVSWMDLSFIPFYNEGLLFASILLSVGIIVLWSSLARKSISNKHYS